VRRRPADPEELGEDRGFGLEQALAVAGVCPALLREQEARAGDYPARAGSEGGADVAPLGDPTRQLVAAEAAPHAGLDDRRRDAEGFEDRHPGDSRPCIASLRQNEGCEKMPP
jgi:hypothetical protein